MFLYHEDQVILILALARFWFRGLFKIPLFDVFG
jgi:hypothetical protein